MKMKHFTLLLVLLALCIFPIHSQNTNSSTPPFTETEIPEEPTHSRFISELFNVFFILGLLVALMIGVSWFLKKFLHTRTQQINVSSSIKILERRNLSPKSAIILVEIAGRQIAIAESPTGICRLAEFHTLKEERKNFEEMMEK